MYGYENAVFGSWYPLLELDGRTLTPDRIEEITAGEVYELYFTAERLVWRWRFETAVTEHESRMLLASTLVNTGDTAHSLGRAWILDAAADVPAHEVVALGVPLLIGNAMRLVLNVNHPDAPRGSAVKFQYFDRTARRAWQIGFITFQRQKTVSAYQCGEDGKLERFSADCDFAGRSITPGEELALETFTFAVGANPYRQLERWADLAAGEIQPVFREQAALGCLGWAWSIEPDGPETRKERVLRNAKALREKLGGFGFEYFWVSIANLPGGNPGAWLDWNENNLPGGLDALVRELGEFGLKLGLWCGPFYLSSALGELVNELSDALLRNPDGTPLIVCEKWRHGDAGKLPKSERPDLYALDPSHPKTQEFLRRAFEFYREHGVRYFMIDFTEAGAGNLGRFSYAKHCNERLTAGPEALLSCMKVIRDTAGTETFLLGSTGPTLHLAGFVDAMRTGNDFGEGRQIAPEAFFYPASYVINGIGFWTGPGWALNNAGAAYYTHRKLYLNDSGNVLTVDQPLPLEHARIHAAIHGFSGASTMLGDDLSAIAPERLALIKKTLPRSPETAFPLDLFSSVNNERPQNFSRRIVREWGGWRVLALYNLSDRVVRRRIEFTELGWSEKSEALIWEFWGERYCGAAAGALEVEIPAETVRIYRLTPMTGHPQMIGTDMHMTMGEMEIGECRYDEANMTLVFSVRRPAGERGSVFLLAPKGFRVVNTGDCFIAKDALDENLIIRVPVIAGEDGFCRRRIEFARIGAEKAGSVTTGNIQAEMAEFA